MQTEAALAVIALLFALLPTPAHAQDPEPIHVPMDLQGHPAMHLTWKFFGRGLIEDRKSVV